MKNLKFVFFFVFGVVFGVVLLVLSEISKFSHLNLAPFGGKSWAMWAYPVAFCIGFVISFFIFKVNKPKLLLVLAVLIFAVFIIFLKGSLFVNFLPFGY